MHRISSRRSTVTDNELAFAEKESSRAEISRWCFSNEYNYGSFHGDVDGMLRRGFDVFLECANDGTRTLKIRLPSGLPFKNFQAERAAKSGEYRTIYRSFVPIEDK